MAIPDPEKSVIPIRFISTHRADAGHVDPLRERAASDSRFSVVDDNSGIVFAQGDRSELLSAVESAVRDNAVIAHAGGGERTKGSTDDRVRDAMTKLAHLHYPVNPTAARRLIEMGEEPHRICMVGEIGSDTIFNLKDEPLPLGVNPKYGDVVLALHPATARPGDISYDVSRAVDHAAAFMVTGSRLWLVEPNGDPGSDVIRKRWDELCAMGSASYLRGLTHRQFLTVMRRCSYIVGNSSCLITEAPLLGVRHIQLIGSRQEGRERSFSDGRACPRVLDHMAFLWLHPNLRVKA